MMSEFTQSAKEHPRKVNHTHQENGNITFPRFQMRQAYIAHIDVLQNESSKMRNKDGFI
jgi:hypothetical protein